MKKITASLFCFCLTFSTLVVAKEASRQMDEFKQKLIQHVDNEIELLTQFKTCIQTAQKRADFEVCKNAKNEAQKKTMVEMKNERLENRKKQLAIEEKKLNEALKLEKK